MTLITSPIKAKGMYIINPIGSNTNNKIPPTNKNTNFNNLKLTFIASPNPAIMINKPNSISICHTPYTATLSM